MEKYKIPNSLRDTPRLANFLDELLTLYKKYGISISHEDCHGGFEIEDYSEFNVEWMKEAAVRTLGWEDDPTVREI